MKAKAQLFAISDSPRPPTSGSHSPPPTSTYSSSLRGTTCCCTIRTRNGAQSYHTISNQNRQNRISEDTYSPHKWPFESKKDGLPLLQHVLLKKWQFISLLDQTRCAVFMGEALCRSPHDHHKQQKSHLSCCATLEMPAELAEHCMVVVVVKKSPTKKGGEIIQSPNSR